MIKSSAKSRKRARTIKSMDAEVRERVFDRDGHACVRCGSTKSLSPSHVYPKGKYPRLRFLEINILTMCYADHIHWWHKNPIEATEWFLKTFPDRARQLAMLKDTAPKVVIGG